MKRMLSLVIMVFLIAGYAIESKQNFFSEPIFHTNGVASKHLKQIFDHIQAPIETLAEANDFAQKNLLRKGERWDKQDETDVQKRIRTNEALLTEDLRNIGMIDEILPQRKTYTYALLMGALKSRVAMRLDHLQKLMKQGYVFDTIVLLGGERQLKDDEKNGLPVTVTTEAEMMEFLCKQEPFLKEKHLLVVNAPMIKNLDGSVTRPTTDSTLVHFSTIAPKDGSCLVISNSPYTIRQTKVAQRILDQSRFPIDGAGSSLQKSSFDVVIAMDEFARTLYEEKLMYTKVQELSQS